jgi:large subunit ribosomal protein L24
MTTKINFSLKKGDLVKIIAGKQKGVTAKILFINYKKSTAILDTENFRKKFSKNVQQIEEKKVPIPIHISNLMGWDENLKQVSRIGFKFLNNKKQRYFKKSGSIISTTLNSQNE